MIICNNYSLVMLLIVSVKMFLTECSKEGKEKRRNIRKPKKIREKEKEKVLHAVSVYLKTKLLDSFNPYFPSK